MDGADYLDGGRRGGGDAAAARKDRHGRIGRSATGGLAQATAALATGGGHPADAEGGECRYYDAHSRKMNNSNRDHRHHHQRGYSAAMPDADRASDEGQWEGYGREPRDAARSPEGYPRGAWPPPDADRWLMEKTAKEAGAVAVGGGVHDALIDLRSGSTRPRHATAAGGRVGAPPSGGRRSGGRDNGQKHGADAKPYTA